MSKIDFSRNVEKRRLKKITIARVACSIWAERERKVCYEILILGRWARVS